MKIGVLLAGSGVYDGSEIHEAVFTLLAIEENNAEAVCFAPDKEQFHVVNHLTGDEMNEKRNVLVEAARIARGKIKSIKEINSTNFDALIIPGGFGAAKNLNQWAISGPSGTIDENVKRIILDTLRAQKPLAGICMGPTVIAKALEGTGINATLTVGTDQAPSPYDIKGISSGIESLGSKTVMKGITEIAVDEKNNIVTAPCYMMVANILEIRNNVKQAVDHLVKLVKDKTKVEASIA